ncbi:TBC1 domain family member 15-like isoform X2 [Oryzias latipes]|uniref:TBC1 domain family member 15-like isoform X2 n=1 Tax=Oryzias latipes TaxID=8090 RepID=UPI0005CBC731|nr:TBC1 domain family member 15-like isoform X2 [Oryzias latipes]
MEDLDGGTVRQTAGQRETRRVPPQEEPNAPIRRRVAAVSCPALSAARLAIPGVMDAEGRVDESRLRMHICKNGGTSPSDRGLVWRFLFGMYPCSSTALERSLLQEQLFVRYRVMKKKWQTFLPSAKKISLNGTDVELIKAVRYFEEREAEAQQENQFQSEEVQVRLAFLELQAQFLFGGVSFHREELQEAIRIIDKDVPRTNRDLSYYQNEGLGNLLVLRDILITYAAFHPEVSYAQGMNDLCSRFLEVLDCEIDTFWSFSCYMEKFSKDFQADGLHRKIVLEAALLKELDPPLYAHLAKDNMESLTFCHREFEHSEALRLFEILSCDHLELISQQVDRARHHERLAQENIEEDSPESELHTINTDFTFELFVCAAILLDNRDSLLQCRDDVQLIQFTSSLHRKLDLNSMLQKAERHFYNYCKSCSWDYMNGRCRVNTNTQEDFIDHLRSFFALKR